MAVAVAAEDDEAAICIDEIKELLTTKSTAPASNIYHPEVLRETPPEPDDDKDLLCLVVDSCTLAAGSTLMVFTATMVDRGACIYVGIELSCD